MRKAKRAAARRGRGLRIMFADEARFGRINRPRPCWAPIVWEKSARKSSRTTPSNRSTPSAPSSSTRSSISNAIQNSSNQSRRFPISPSHSDNGTRRTCRGADLEKYVTYGAKLRFRSWMKRGGPKSVQFIVVQLIVVALAERSQNKIGFKGRLGELKALGVAWAGNSSAGMASLIGQ